MPKGGGGIASSSPGFSGGPVGGGGGFGGFLGALALAAGVPPAQLGALQGALEQGYTPDQIAGHIIGEKNRLGNVAARMGNLGHAATVPRLTGGMQQPRFPGPNAIPPRINFIDRGA